MNWTQLSLAKIYTIRERVRLHLRVDANNFPLKQPQFNNPNSTFNANTPGSFARIGSSTRGAFSDVGTGNSNLLLLLKVQL